MSNKGFGFVWFHVSYMESKWVVWRGSYRVICVDVLFCLCCVFYAWFVCRRFFVFLMAVRRCLHNRVGLLGLNAFLMQGNPDLLVPIYI